MEGVGGHRRAREELRWSRGKSRDDATSPPGQRAPLRDVTRATLAIATLSHEKGTRSRPVGYLRIGGKKIKLQVLRRRVLTRDESRVYLAGVHRVEQFLLLFQFQRHRRQASRCVAKSRKFKLISFNLFIFFFVSGESDEIFGA